MRVRVQVRAVSWQVRFWQLCTGALGGAMTPVLSFTLYYTWSRYSPQVSGLPDILLDEAGSYRALCQPCSRLAGEYVDAVGAVELFCCMPCVCVLAHVAAAVPIIVLPQNIYRPRISCKTNVLVCKRVYTHRPLY